MRIGALDISKNKVGIAFSDEDNIFIAYENTLNPYNLKKFRRELKSIFIKYKPHITYVGLPLTNDNILNESCKFIKNFTHNLRDIIGKFEFIDEGFSTCYAESLISNNLIKNFHSVDSIVAKNIIMQVNKLYFN